MKLPISLVLVALMAHNAYQQVLNCYVPADIMILIDGSDSIQDQNWREIKNFVSQLVTNFDVGRDAIHVGFVVYSSDVGDHIGLQPFKPKNVLRTLSGILRQPKASTNTAKGIAYVRNEFKTRGRAGVPKILIVITDGSSDNPRETRKQANIAKIEGIRVIAVGIGQTFRDELRQIASRPEKVYTAASFATLQTLVFEIQRMVCTVITTTTTTTTAIPIPTKPPVVIPVPSDKICDVPGDIVFVMDGSDSIDDADFIRQKQFVANLIDNFEISTDAIHVGLIVYSTIIGDTVGLQPPKNKELLKILARNLRHPKVGTNTARGIERARDMIRKEGRAMAPKMIVVITDGRSSSPKLTVAQANMAKVEGITLVSVGVGTQIFSDELNQIASSRRKVFEVSDFRSLELIITSMRDLLCQAITTTTSTTTTTQKPTYIPPPDDLFCNVPADVGILLDGSDSIADADWTKQKYFIASLINNLAVGRDTIHVGVVVFSTIIGETVGLTPFKPKELLMILSNNLKQPKVGTNTALGIQRMRQMLASQGRANAPKVMIIVTDGKSSSPKRTVAQASLAKKEGITVIAVGVGSQLFREELSQIATNDRKLFTVSDFQGLQQIIVTLRNLICQVITTTSTTQLVTTPIPPPVTLQPYPGCEVPAEIMFMMHGSDDIKDDNWGMNKKFVSSLVRNLYVNRGAHHVGMVVYSSSVGDHMSLQPFKEVFDVQNHINSFSHPRGGANTAAALAKIREAFRTHARGGAPKIGVLITDQKSTTPADTKLQAELAKNEGVQFVTLGIGSKVNIGELAHIATDSQKLFRAMNFKRLESMMPRIRDMICEIVTTPVTTTTTTTTTPPPPVSTPAPDFTQLCAGCLMNSDSGFNPYPGDCTRYVQCWRDGGRIIGAVKVCPYGQFWDEDAITCRPSMNVMCPQDPCINAPDGFTLGIADHGCRSHWVCVKGYSVASCCPEGTYYVEGMGCMRGMACKMPCPPDGGLIISPNCDKEVHWDGRFYLENVPGKGKMVRRCAPGTIFDKGYCTCVIATSNYVPVTPTDKCMESVHLNFDVNMKDKSGKSTQINNFAVRKTKYGTAHFNGNSYLNLWNLGNIDYTDKFALKFKFKFDRWENRFDMGGYPVDAGWKGDFLWKWDSQTGWNRNSTVGGSWKVVTLMNMFKRMFAATSENEMETIMVEMATSPDFQILLYHLGFMPQSTNAIQILRQLMSGNGAVFIRQIIRQIGNMQGGVKTRRLLLQLLMMREVDDWVRKHSGIHVDITMQNWRQFLSSLNLTDSGWDISGGWNSGMDDRTFDIIADLWYQFVRENGMTGPEWDGKLTWALGNDRQKGSMDKRWIFDILFATKNATIKNIWLDHLNKRNYSIDWINTEWQIGGGIGGTGGASGGIGGSGGMGQGQWNAWLNWLMATYGSQGGTGTGQGWGQGWGNGGGQGGGHGGGQGGGHGGGQGGGQGGGHGGQGGFTFDSFFHWLLGSGSFGNDFSISGGSVNGGQGQNNGQGQGWFWGGNGQGNGGSGAGNGGWLWGSGTGSQTGVNVGIHGTNDFWNSGNGQNGFTNGGSAGGNGYGDSQGGTNMNTWGEGSAGSWGGIGGQGQGDSQGGYNGGSNWGADFGGQGQSVSQGGFNVGKTGYGGSGGQWQGGSQIGDDVWGNGQGQGGYNSGSIGNGNGGTGMSTQGEGGFWFGGQGGVGAGGQGGIMIGGQGGQGLGGQGGAGAGGQGGAWVGGHGGAGTGGQGGAGTGGQGGAGAGGQGGAGAGGQGGAGAGGQGGAWAGGQGGAGAGGQGGAWAGGQGGWGIEGQSGSQGGTNGGTIGGGEQVRTGGMGELGQENGGMFGGAGSNGQSRGQWNTNSVSNGQWGTVGGDIGGGRVWFGSSGGKGLGGAGSQWGVGQNGQGLHFNGANGQGSFTEGGAVQNGFGQGSAGRFAKGAAWQTGFGQGSAGSMAGSGAWQTGFGQGGAGSLAVGGSEQNGFGQGGAGGWAVGGSEQNGFGQSGARGLAVGGSEQNGFGQGGAGGWAVGGSEQNGFGKGGAGSVAENGAWQIGQQGGYGNNGINLDGSQGNGGSWNPKLQVFGVNDKSGNQGFWGFDQGGTGLGGGISGGSSGGSFGFGGAGSSGEVEVGDINSILNNLGGAVGSQGGSSSSSSQESGEIQMGYGRGLSGGSSSGGGSSSAGHTSTGSSSSQSSSQEGYQSQRHRGNNWTYRQNHLQIPAFDFDALEFPDLFRKKRAAPNGDIFQYQTLLTNCQSTQGASVNIAANERTVKLGMMTEGSNKMTEMEFNIVPGWNEVTMTYDGKNLMSKIQNWRGAQERSAPLTGNIQKRQGFKIGGACGANVNFKGQMDDILLYNCLPSKFKQGPRGNQ